MSRRSAWGLMLGIGVACLLVGAGCGKGTGAGATAQATAESFAAALSAGKLVDAARAIDYVESARAQNENWDDIPGGQRDLIVKKLAEQKAAELAGYQQVLGAKPTVAVNGDGTATISGAAGALNLAFVEREGKFFISQLW